MVIRYALPPIKRGFVQVVHQINNLSHKNLDLPCMENFIRLFFEYNIKCSKLPDAQSAGKSLQNIPNSKTKSAKL
jgi:hypothetical protein